MVLLQSVPAGLSQDQTSQALASTVAALPQGAARLIQSCCHECGNHLESSNRPPKILPCSSKPLISLYLYHSKEACRQEDHMPGSAGMTVPAWAGCHGPPSDPQSPVHHDLGV